MTAFDIDADLFMRVRAAVGSEQIRYYLAGIFVEPIEGGGAWLVATNGHMMLVGRDVTAVAPRPAIIRLDMADVYETDVDECEECGGAVTAGRRTFEGHRLRFDLPEKASACLASFTAGCSRKLHAVATEIDGEFPKWRTPWNGKAARVDEAAIGLDPRLLLKLAGDLRLYLQKTYPGGPFVLTFSGYPSLTGLLMPCKVRSLGTELASELLGAETDQ